MRPYDQMDSAPINVPNPTTNPTYAWIIDNVIAVYEKNLDWNCRRSAEPAAAAAGRTNDNSTDNSKDNADGANGSAPIGDARPDSRPARTPRRATGTRGVSMSRLPEPLRSERAPRGADCRRRQSQLATALRRHGLARRGVLLLVVLSMLALFALIGVTFVLVASQHRRALRAESRAEQYGDDYRKQLDNVFAQIVRDVVVQPVQTPAARSHPSRRSPTTACSTTSTARMGPRGRPAAATG